MAEVKVTVRFDIEKSIRKFLTSGDINEIGKALVDKSKDFISKGISPVRGDRRFSGYKNPSRYPGNRKPKRPVNLYLSGDMLRDLKFRNAGQDKIEFGIITSDIKVGIRAEAHNDGPTNNAFEQRAFIPDKPGQEFAVAIMRLVKQVYEKRLADIIARSNK